VHGVEVLVRGGPGVLLDQEPAIEDPERFTGGSSFVARAGARLVEHPVAEDPLSPAEVDVLEVREVGGVETAALEELTLPDQHVPAAREEPLVAGSAAEIGRDRTAGSVRESVAVEHQEAVREIDPRPRSVGQPSGKRVHVGRKGAGGFKETGEPSRIGNRVVV
jgi:hypothetical protein